MGTRYVVYVSRLSEAAGPGSVPSIIRVARANNGARAISGALLFDGERFCQYIEGDDEAIERTFSAIQADDRHAEVRVLDRGFAEARRFAHWSMAFVRAATPDVIDTIAGLPTPAVVEGFSYMIGQCDREV